MSTTDSTEKIFTALRDALISQYKAQSNLKEIPPEVKKKIEKISLRVVDETSTEQRQKILQKHKLLSNELHTLSMELFPKGKPLAIFSFDLDKIHNYVFDTPKLPEIRGGSGILKELLEKYIPDEEEKKQKKLNPKNIIISYLEKFALTESNLIYAAGGGGLLILPIHLAQEFKEYIEAEVSQRTLTATITCEYESVHPIELIFGWRCTEFWLDDVYELIFDKTNKTLKSEQVRCLENQFNLDLNNAGINESNKWLEDNIETWLSRKKFGEIISVLGQKLQQAKNKKPFRPFYETIPQAERCESCRIRPATTAHEENKMCDICYKKHDKGHKLKLQDEKRYPKDLEELGKLSNGRAKGYVAVISADGNGMGSIFEKLSSIVDYCIWSDLVLDAFHSEKIIHQTLSEHGIKTYESLVFGGDDLLLLIQADKVFEVLPNLIERIEDVFKNDSRRDYLNRRCPELTDTYLSISVGILIAKGHYPAKFLINYAERGLQKNAKYRSKQEKSNPSIVDFMVLADGSPLSISIKELREQLFSRHKPNKYSGTEEVTHYYQRPYTINEFKEFLREARSLKKHVSTRQIYLMREIIGQGRQESVLNFLYQTARDTSGKIGWRKWIQLIKEKKAWNTLLPAELWNFIWHEEKEDDLPVYSTRFMDYVEILDFISELNEEKTNV